VNRLAFVLALFGAVGWVLWATHADAFETTAESATNADGTAGFSDPDDQVPPGLLQVAPDLQDYQGTANQLTPDQSGWIFSIAPQR
jgi:hypothetical protein